LVAAQHHQWDDAYATPWTEGRGDWYGVSALPEVRFDGARPVVGAGSCLGAAAEYRQKILERLGETHGQSPVSIVGDHIPGASSISLKALVRLEDDVSLLSPRLFLLVLENDLLSGGHTFHHVTRAAYEEDLTLDDPGDEVQVTAEIPLDPTWVRENLQCVAFLQQMGGDKEVYQAAPLPRVPDFEFTYDRGILSAPEGNRVVAFGGDLTNVGTATDVLTITLDDTFGWPAEFRVGDEPEFHGEPTVVSLNPGEHLSVQLRVSTDAELRVGEGGLTVLSETTGRPELSVARLFNGSPSILVVDDDGIRDDEVIIFSALTVGGYLADHWDVYNDHSDQAPVMADVKDYDLLIWSNGWFSSDLLPEYERETLMAYLDQGRGLILCSQDFLSHVEPGPFTSDYLGIASWTTNLSAEALTGVPHDPISGGMAFPLDYPYAHLNRPDDLEPNALGTVIFRSEFDDRVAVRTDNGTSRSVVLAFLLNAMDEGLPDPNNPATLIGRSIAWIMEGMIAGVDETAEVARGAQIASIHPNPLCLGLGGGAATIQLDLSPRSARGRVEVDVLDVNGRHLRSLHPIGRSRFTWDGRNDAGRPVAGGVCYVRLRTCEGASGARLLVLR